MKRYSKNKLAEALCRLYLSVPESCMEDFEIIRQGIIELNEIREALTFESLNEIASEDGKREVHKVWRDGMLRQGRVVSDERMKWDTLSHDDHLLDEDIAFNMFQFLADKVTKRINEIGES